MKTSVILFLLVPLVAACATGPSGPRSTARPVRAALPADLPEAASPAAVPTASVPTASVPTVAEGDHGGAVVDAAHTPATGDAAPQDPAVRSAAPTRSDRLHSIELRIWNDPAFHERFAESYLSETEIEPGVSLEERDVMLEVLDLIAADELDEAAELVEDSRNDASTAVYDFTLANIYFQQERFDDAMRACREAIDKHPKFRRAWKMLGQILVRRGDFSEALPALTRVVELGGGDAVSYGTLGFAYLNTGDYLPAESAFRMALLMDPYTRDWKLGLAESLFREGRYSEAVALFGKLIEDNPQSAELWLAQGEAFARTGEVLRAAENFEMVDRLGGSSFDSLVNLGDIYANSELFEMAVSAYKRAMLRDPQRRSDRIVRAAKYLSANGALDQTRELVEAIEAAGGETLDVDTRKDLLRLRARIAVAQGMGEEEATILEEIVALDPLDGDALILLGQHAGREGEVEQAIFYFERAANIDGFEPDAKVRHAQLLVSQERYAEALPLLRRAQQLEPRDSVQQYLEQVERFAQGR